MESTRFWPWGMWGSPDAAPVGWPRGLVLGRDDVENAPELMGQRDPVNSDGLPELLVRQQGPALRCDDERGAANFADSWWVVAAHV